MIKVDRIYLPVNMALAFFINNCKQIEIFVKGVSGKSGLFLIVLPIGIAYWLLLFRLVSLVPISLLASISIVHQRGFNSNNRFNHNVN